MDGEKIKWRIRIVNKKGEIGLGIGLKNVLKLNNFQIENWNDSNGCYVVGYGKYAWRYMDR